MTTERLTAEDERGIRYDVRPGSNVSYAEPKWKEDVRKLLDELDAVRDDLLREMLRLGQEVDALTRELAEARKISVRVDKNADRWEWFADSDGRETSTNGDNAFVRYVGPWVVAEYKHDPEDGDNLLPSTADEWIAAAMAKDGA